MATMTTDRLLEKLAEAKRCCEEARHQMSTARTKKAQREAEEDLNFWQGKASYYFSWLQQEAKGQQ